MAKDEVNSVVEQDAKTFRSRDETEKHAKILCDKLNGLNSSNQRNQAYRINKVDHSVCSRSSITTVSRELYSLGYKADNFKSLGWKIDPKLKDGKFYSINGKFPVLIRETNTQWGVVVTLLGEYLPIFHDAMDALEDIINDDRELTVMHPVEGTSGMALICGLKREVQANDKLLVPLKLDDALLGRGFVRKNGSYISIPLGVIVAKMDHHIVLVDTPWA